MQTHRHGQCECPEHVNSVNQLCRQCKAEWEDFLADEAAKAYEAARLYEQGVSLSWEVA